MREKIRVNVTLGRDQMVRLKERLKTEDTNVSQLLRRLIDEYLKKGGTR
jgi:hypothetical protein